MTIDEAWEMMGNEPNNLGDQMAKTVDRKKTRTLRATDDLWEWLDEEAKRRELGGRGELIKILKVEEVKRMRRRK